MIQAPLLDDDRSIPTAIDSIIIVLLKLFSFPSAWSVTGGATSATVTEE